MSTAYGSNADRLKKAVAKHSSHPSLNSAASVDNNRTSTASSKYSRASTCSTSSSSSAGSTNMRYQEVAHLMPYIHSNSAASAQFTNSTDTRRSSRSNSTTLSEVSVASYRSPKRLFEKAGTDDAPSMVVTRSKNSFGHSPDPYMIAPVTPIMEDMDKFADYVYENEELKANSDLFLPMRVKELNLDLDNVLRDAYVSTIKHNDKETSDAASTTSSSYSKVLAYEAYDYDTTVPKVDNIAAAAVTDDHPTRKQSVNFGSKVKKFAKKITA